MSRIKIMLGIKAHLLTMKGQIHQFNHHSSIFPQQLPAVTVRCLGEYDMLFIKLQINALTIFLYFVNRTA